MEDQISRTNEHSWSKDLAEIHSMLQELVATSKPSQMEFQRFYGDDPEIWISQAERYFDFYEIAENHKLSMASSYLDGEALTWYRWLFQNKQLVDWKHFTAKVLIRFRKCHLKSPEGCLANLKQVPSVTEYPSRFEAISSGFSEPDILSPCLAHVHPQRSDITNSLLPQNYDEPSECKSNINACKVFDELSDRYEYTNPLDTSRKPIELSISPNDLVNSISRIVVVNGCNDDAKTENKNDEEKIVSIKDEPIEFFIANADKPSLWIDSTVYIPCDLAMFDIDKVLDDPWNQLLVGYFEKVYSLELAQRWEEMPSIPSTCSSAKLINRGITDHLRGLGHATSILTLHIFPSDQFGLEFSFNPRSSLLNMFLRVTRHSVFCLDHDKFIMSNFWNSCNWFDTGQDAPLLISGDARRNYICSFKSTHTEQNLSNFTINCSRLVNNLGRGCSQFSTQHADELRPRYFLVFHVNQKACHILGLTDMLCAIAYSYSLTEVWDPGRHLLVNFYVSKIIGNKIGGVDISDILLQADKCGTNDSPVEGSNRSWVCLHTATHDLTLVPLEPLSSYADVHEDVKQGLANDRKLPWTYHTLCNVYQCDFCYREAVLKETNCSTPWSPLSSFICTHNEWCTALCYMEKTGMKLPCSFTDVFLSSKLVEQMVVPVIAFKTAGSFSLSVCLNKDPIGANEEMLAISGSSSLFGICYMPPKVVVENLPVPLPSMLYHMDRSLHKTNVLLLNYSEKLFYESVIFPSLLWLYSNLEDKVLISGGSIVVNTTGQVVGPEAKPQRGPRIIQPNTSFAWDPG